MNIYSRDEIEKILHQYGDMVYRMAYIQVKNSDVADDIYQEVWIKLIRQKYHIEPEEHLKAWLLRTTINCCKDYWKSAWMQKISWKESKQEFSEENQDCGELWETLEFCSGGSGKCRETWELYREVGEKQVGGYVTECVRKLPEKYRTVIHLYYYEGYDQKEIASLLGTNENTIASRMVRGRERLKKIMKEDEVRAYGY